MHNRSHASRLALALAVVLSLGLGLAGCQLIEVRPGAPTAPQGTIEPAPQSPAQTQAPEPSPTSMPAGEGAPEDLGAGAIPARLGYVVDGDTVELVITQSTTAHGHSYQRGEAISLRVLGINTPELNRHKSKNPECGAEEATENMKMLTGAYEQALWVIPDPKSDALDRYGRTLGYLVAPDGTDLGAEQLKAGFAAPHYPKSAATPTRFPSYKSFYEQASDQRLGNIAACP